MKKLLFLFLAVTLLTACDEKATDDSLSVSKDLLEFKPEGGTQEFQIFSNTGWKIIVADENSEVYLSATSGHGNTTISVTLSGGRLTETTTRLIVRSDDGASLKNVKLIQHGYSGNNVILNISNVDKYLIMNGTAYSEDSLTIHTNVPWQLKGPEWIEVYNGKEWVKLSMEHANITGNATMKSASGQNDTYDLKIRCASENADEEDRNGAIILESTYTKDKGDEITVSQLGRLRVNADALVLAHDMAWAWKYGKDVATIKYRVGTQSYQNFITEDEMKNWATAQPDLIYCTYNLKASTAYFIYAYGLDAAGGGCVDRPSPGRARAAGSAHARSSVACARGESVRMHEARRRALDRPFSRRAGARMHAQYACALRTRRAASSRKSDQVPRDVWHDDGEGGGISRRREAAAWMAGGLREQGCVRRVRPGAARRACAIQAGGRREGRAYAVLRIRCARLHW